MKSILKDRQTSLAIFGLFLLLCVAQSAKAQSPNSLKKEAALKETPAAMDAAEENSEESLDTEESLKYVGNRLLFQVKKRLHLTTEEDEEEEKSEKKKKVKLNIFGIEVEKT